MGLHLEGIGRTTAETNALMTTAEALLTLVVLMIASLIAMNVVLLVTTVTQTHLIVNMVATMMMTTMMMTTMMMMTMMTTTRRSQRRSQRRKTQRLGADRSVKRMAKLGMICSIANPSVITHLRIHLRILCASLNAWLLLQFRQ